MIMIMYFLFLYFGCCVPIAIWLTGKRLKGISGLYSSLGFNEHMQQSLSVGGHCLTLHFHQRGVHRYRSTWKPNSTRVNWFGYFCCPRLTRTDQTKTPLVRVIGLSISNPTPDHPTRINIIIIIFKKIGICFSATLLHSTLLISLHPIRSVFSATALHRRQPRLDVSSLLRRTMSPGRVSLPPSHNLT